MTSVRGCERQAPGPERVEEIRQEIVTMYKVHAPKHLAEVDSTMEEWAGEEHVLLAQVRDRWGGKKRKKKPVKLKEEAGGEGQKDEAVDAAAA